MNLACSARRQCSVLHASRAVVSFACRSDLCTGLGAMIHVSVEPIKQNFGSRADRAAAFLSSAKKNRNLGIR
jgi:hypothetical protein